MLWLARLVVVVAHRSESKLLVVETVVVECYPPLVHGLAHLNVEVVVAALVLVVDHDANPYSTSAATMAS